MKAAIIEFGTSHTEIIYSQLLFLKEGGAEVSLFINEKLRESAEWFGDLCDITFLPFNDFKASRASYAEIKKKLTTENFTHFILNSAEGALARNFLLTRLPRSIQRAGIIHNTDKLTGSTTQKIITARLDKYFVLSDYMMQHLPKNFKKPTASFYPIFEPEYKDASVQFPKTSGEFRVGIPGTVEFSRRDYEGLLEELKLKRPNGNIKFILLGPGNNRDSNLNQILNELHNLGLKDGFIYFEDYIDNDTFYTYLKSCDALLPLINADKSQYAKFIKHKITGTYNLSYAWKIPMINHASLNAIDDFAENGIFYNSERLSETLNKFSGDKELYNSVKSNMLMASKWGFEYQQNRYISFLEESV